MTVIMDNAGFHRKAMHKKIGEKAGVNLLFLPPYSPDLNPIEKGWAKRQRANEVGRQLCWRTLPMKRELRDCAHLDQLLETSIYKYWS